MVKRKAEYVMCPICKRRFFGDDQDKCATGHPVVNLIPVAGQENILQEAHRLVDGDRDKSYGGWNEDFSRTAKLASILTKKELTALDVIKIMVCVKLSRSSNRYKRDNLVDACGYLEGWNEIEGKKDV